MIGATDDLRLRCIGEERLEVIIQAVPVSPLFGRENRLAVLLGLKQCGQLWGRPGWDGREQAQQFRSYQPKRFQAEPPGAPLGLAAQYTRTPMAPAASVAAIAPAVK